MGHQFSRPEAVFGPDNRNLGGRIRSQSRVGFGVRKDGFRGRDLGLKVDLDGTVFGFSFGDPNAVMRTGIEAKRRPNAGVCR